MSELEERLRRAARILGSLTEEEQAAWSDQLDALAREDYRSASASMDRINELAEAAHQEGRPSDVDHLALLSLARDMASR